MLTPQDLMAKSLKAQKIFEVTDSDILKTLAKIYVLVGLRPQHMPSPEIDNYNIGFIRRNFSARPLSEIEIAFELAITGKLDIDDAKCYDQFTMEYFCRIMNAYRVYFNQNPPKIENKPQETPKIENTIIPTQKKQEVAGWLKSTLKSFGDIPLYLYDYFDELGYVKLSGEEKYEYMERAYRFILDGYTKSFDWKAAKEIKKEYEKGGIKGIKGFELNRIKTVAKKNIIFDIIKKHQNEKQD